jgi:hypothetical protein
MPDSACQTVHARTTKPMWHESVLPDNCQHDSMQQQECRAWLHVQDLKMHLAVQVACAVHRAYMTCCSLLCPRRQDWRQVI